MSSSRKLLDVFLVSLRLGLASFGGPVAHIGYFEQAYVRQKQWLEAEAFSRTVALCQLLPGPTSSQVNFLVGLQRAGWGGALLSWAGFTLPSALLMYAFAVLAPRAGGVWMEASLHGLKLVAVAVVAQAVWSMATRLCPDRVRLAIAFACAALLLFVSGVFMQIAALALGAVAGAVFCRDIAQDGGAVPSPAGKKAAVAAAVLFFVLLAVLPLLASLSPAGLARMADVSYRSGALVFGGGHVVLPLLRDGLVPAGIMTDDAFLAGYGAAQALPGPLFALSSYLGAAAAPDGGQALWALCALLFLFLPGLLAAVAGAPLWGWLGTRKKAQAALAGVNAAVVGILGAALCDPVATGAVFGMGDAAVAVAGFILLERFKVPPAAVVVFCVAAAVLLRML